MKEIKLLLLSVLISSLIAVFMFIWCEPEISYDATTCKVFETMFVIVSVVVALNVSRINSDKI